MMSGETSHFSLIAYLEQLGFLPPALQAADHLVFDLQTVLRQETVNDPQEVLKDLETVITELAKTGRSRVAILNWMLAYCELLGCKPIDWLISCGYEQGVDRVIEVTPSLVGAPIEVPAEDSSGGVVVPFRRRNGPRHRRRPR